MRETKRLLFWLYLWQLKEYRWGRFLAHFRTSKGKSILKDGKRWLKLFLLLILWLSSGWLFYGAGVVVGLIFLVETLKAVWDLQRGSLKTPKLTVKTWVLTGMTLGAEFLVAGAVFNFELQILLVGLLLFDILTPVVVTSLVWLLEPLVVLFKKRIFGKAGRKRNDLDQLMVVGITGSYGKTSTKEFLSKLLEDEFKVVKTEQHVNTEIGVAQTILEQVKPKHEIFVAEVGAYQKGEIERTCSFLKPGIGVLAGINEQHLATFSSQQNIIEGKYELVESLPEDGLAVFNGHNSYCRELYNKTEKPKRLIGPEGDLVADEVQVSKDSVSFKIGPHRFELEVLGKDPIQNFLMAVEVARELGVSLEKIAEVAKRKEFGGAQNLIQEDYNVVDSSYSGNPNSVIAHLNYLKEWEGKKVLVMPCLIELGAAAPKIHQQIGEKIAEVCDLAIFTTADYFEEVERGAIENGLKTNQIMLIEDSDEIFERLEGYTGEEDIILLESRVPEALKEKLIE